MKPELRRFGREQSPVVVIDDFTGRLDEVRQVAESLAPFPAIERNYYPGLRRIIGAGDGAANDIVLQLCRDAAPFVAGAFDVDRFELIEASFSMVTTPPSQLRGAQRAPHFDSPDPNYLALLLYLRVPDGSGTAFFRQRSTGIERVTDDKLPRFVSAAEREAALLPAEAGYIHGSDRFFEQIGKVEAVPDRLVIYQGSLLHSGIIPPDMPFSDDPTQGRLTANLFLRARAA